MASSNFALVCGPSLVTKIPNQIMASSPDINIDPSNVFIDLSDLNDAIQKGVSRIYDELNMIVVLDGAFQGKKTAKQKALDFLTLQDILNSLNYRKVRLVLLTKDSELRNQFLDTIDGYNPFMYYNTEVLLSVKVGLKVLTKVLSGDYTGTGLHAPETRKKSQLELLEEDKQKLISEVNQVSPEFLEADKNIPISKLSESDYIDSAKTEKKLLSDKKEELRNQRLTEREQKNQTKDTPSNYNSVPKEFDESIRPSLESSPTNSNDRKLLDRLKEEREFINFNSSNKADAIAKININTSKPVEVASIKDIKELYKKMLSDGLGTVEEKLSTDHAIISVVSDNNSGGSGFVAQTAETYAMLGKKVCIFNLDLEKRSQTLYFSNFDKCVDEGKGLGNALLNVASGGLLEKAAVKVTSNISLVGISRTMDVIADDFTKTIANSLKEILKDATKLYDIVLIDLPMSYLKYYITCLDVIDRNFFIIENTFYKFEHFFGVRIQQLLGDSLLISKPFIQKSSIVLNKYNPYNRDKKGYAISRSRIKDLLIEAGQPYDELFVVGEIPFYEDWEQQYLTNVRYLWKNEVALGVYKNILKEGV